MQHHRGVKSILIGLCLVLLATGGLLTIVGSGGGGGDDPDPEGSLRFMNGLTCGGRGFSVRLTMGGRNINAFTNRWSACMPFPPNTYAAEIFFVCGTSSYRGTVNIPIQDQCTTNARVRISGGRIYMEFPRNCPGVCIRGKAESADSTETTAIDFEEVIFDIPLDELDIDAFKVVE